MINADRAAQWAERCRVRRVPAANRAQEGAEPRALRAGRREALRRRSSTIQFDGTRRLVVARAHKRFRCASARLGLDCTHCGCRGRTAAGAKPEPVRASPRFGPGEPRRGAGWPPPCRGAGLAACLVSRPVPGRAWAWGRATERQGRRRLQKSIRSTILRIGVVSPTGLIALGI